MSVHYSIYFILEGYCAFYKIFLTAKISKLGCQFIGSLCYSYLHSDINITPSNYQHYVHNQCPQCKYMISQFSNIKNDGN